MTMINILTPEGHEALRQLSQKKTVYCFDFDGTLAPIIQNPAESVLSNEIKQKLLQIQKLFPVAIISGRSLLDLSRIIDFKCNFMVGNHGIEDKNNANIMSECKNITKKWIENLSHIFQVENLNSHFSIDDKEFSVTLHYKKGTNLDKLHTILDKLTPAPRIIAGKLVFSLLPDFGKDKGTAILDLMHKNNFTHALFIGDDVTDEDVFKLENENILTIHVGNNPKSDAKFCLEEQTKIDVLLDKILLSFTGL